MKPFSVAGAPPLMRERRINGFYDARFAERLQPNFRFSRAKLIKSWKFRAQLVYFTCDSARAADLFQPARRPILRKFMLEKIKHRVYDVLVETEDGELFDRVVAVFLMILIVLNSVAVVLETVEDLNARYRAIFDALEKVSVTIFTAEYLLRLWVAPLSPRYSRPFKGRVRYAFSLMAIIDLLAILPFFLPLLFPVDLRIVRFLRVFRLFRLFKMSRYVESLTRLDDVVRSRKEELTVTMVMILMLLLFSSSLMYLVETEAQPDKFPDIPSAMWWGVATLTTVGYGDVFPVTPIGKLLGGFIAFLGIGMFALPTGILASGFAEEIRKKETHECLCPNCGCDISANFERKIK